MKLIYFILDSSTSKNSYWIILKNNVLLIITRNFIIYYLLLLFDVIKYLKNDSFENYKYFYFYINLFIYFSFQMKNIRYNITLRILNWISNKSSKRSFFSCYKIYIGFQQESFQRNWSIRRNVTLKVQRFQ